MKRKLTLLNLALVALLAVTGWRIWLTQKEAGMRRGTVLDQASPPSPVAPLPSVTPPEPVSALEYLDIADLLLFSRDRNPIIEIEAAPPPPLPDLPFVHGILDIGSGPTVILSLKSDGSQAGYQVGDSVGGFVLTGLSANQLTFQFEDRVVSRSVDELKPEPDIEPRRADAPPPKPRQEELKTKVLSKSANTTGPGDVGLGGGMRA
ncbi:MAG: hypothetical protein GY953_53910, partial [bacterium]|nr:hypothetical protein [bacterium]